MKNIFFIRAIFNIDNICKETVFELLKAGHKVTLLVKGLGYVDYNGHLAAIDAMKKLGVEILE